jgi:peptidoglycan/LPS O-acetylase OafA/YrhL
MTGCTNCFGFIAARQLAFGQTSLLVRLGKPIKVAAGYTFSIYLLHRPLQHLASQYFQVATGGGTQALALQTAILAAIVAVGSQTERRTALWRRLITPVIRPLTRPDLQGVNDQNCKVAERHSVSK